MSGPSQQQKDLTNSAKLPSPGKTVVPEASNESLSMPPKPGLLSCSVEQAKELQRIICAKDMHENKESSVKFGEVDQKSDKLKRVRMLQKLINASGVLEKRVAEDGVFGEGTSAAVKDAQRAMGTTIIHDGRSAGRATFAGLVAHALEKGTVSLPDQEKWNRVQPLLKALARKTNGELINHVGDGERSEELSARKERIQLTQLVLDKLGYETGSVYTENGVKKADGEPGEQYKKAIEQFQRDHKGYPDGVAGHSTVRNLVNDYLNKSE